MWPGKWCAVWFGLWGLVTGCNCGGGEVVRQSPPEGEAPASLPPVVLASIEPLPAQTSRGVCYAHSYEDRGERGYGSESSRDSLRELALLNVNSVSLTPFAFMRSLQSSEIRLAGSMAAAETDERMLREFELHAESGNNVMLKPHIWVGGGGFRGHIDPGSDAAWRRWLDSYRRFILHYAQMAEAASAQSFVIGVELDHTTVRFEAEWRSLIDEIRSVYSGELVYAANWDKTGEVPFWDAIDAIGVQFYPPLGSPRESEENKRERLSERLAELELLHERFDRPVILTEVGYRPVTNCDERPHAWPERESAEFDAEAQSRSYSRLLSAVGSREWITGIYFWKWFTDLNSAEEGPTGFSPRQRPAAEVLRRAFDNPESG